MRHACDKDIRNPEFMLDKLEMLIALAREEHFGRAAEACHVTQPTLSSAIKALEEYYAAPLVQRGARFIGLTPEGERVLARARVIMAEARAIRADLEMARHGAEGVLRLGVIPTALAAAQSLTGPFMERHPRMRLQIRSMTSHEIAEGLTDFALDAGISYAAEHSDHALAAGLETMPLYAEEYALVLPEAAVPGSGPLCWSDLGAMRLCLLTPDMQNRRIVDRHLADAGLQVDPAIESNSIIVLISQIMAAGPDVGLATVLPRPMAEYFSRMPGLACVPIESSMRVPDVALILPGVGRRTLLQEAFVQTIKAIERVNRPTE